MDIFLWGDTYASSTACYTLHILRRGVISPARPTPKLVDHPCPFALLFIQYIRSYSLLLEAKIEEIFLCGLFNDFGIWIRYGALN